MKFKALIRKGIDFGYVAEVTALPARVSQGDTVQEALSNIREAIELYVEDMTPKVLMKRVSNMDGQDL